MKIITMAVLTLSLLITDNLTFAQINEFKITAADADTNNQFGISVSISGDYAVVGAWLDADNGDSSGSAYVFKRSGTTWTEEAKLLPSDGSAGDLFGWTVSISGDYAVVGARLDDDSGDASGSAYVFKRTDTTWAQEAKLLASDGALFAEFGISVSISGEYAIVGAYTDDFSSGSAYVFKRSGTTWTQEAKLRASDDTSGDFFGGSVSISGAYAVVGRERDNDNGFHAGSAYVFKRSGTTWTEEAKLLASDGAAADNFGGSVSISGDYAIVSALFDDDNGSGSGSAYMFKRTDTTWTQEAKLLPSDGIVGQQFGGSVAISGDYAVVGAKFDDDNGATSGSAYLYKRTGTSWTQEAKLLASDGIASDRFGTSVSISGEYAIVGAAIDEDLNLGQQPLRDSAYLYNGFIPNDPPFVLNPIQDVVADEDFGSIIVALLDTVFDDPVPLTDSLRYTVSVPSGLVSANIVGDSLRLFSVANLYGMAEVVVTATDDSSASVIDTFMVTVNPLKDPPVVANPITDVVADEDFGSISVALLNTVFSDPDLPNDSLRYTVLVSSGLVTANIAGDSLRLVSVANLYGMAEVVVTATDDSSASVSDTFMVTVNPLKDPPVVANPITDVVADEDFGSISVALLDTVFDDLDLPNDSLRYTVSVPSGLVSATIAGDSLRLFSVGHQNGMAEVVVTATDDSSASVSDTFNITVLPDTISPNLSFSADTLDFSTVFAGYTASKQLIIMNLGIDSLFISDISSDNVLFTTDFDTSDLGANGRDTMTVTFSPVTAGSFTGELSFTSNDHRDSLKTVHLTGNALIAPVISVAPDSIDQVLVTGDSAFHVLTIDNIDGGSDLEWEVTAFASSRVFPNVGPSASKNEKKAGEQIETTETVLLEGALDYAYMAEQTTNSVIVLDTKTNTTVTSVPVGSFPHRLEFSPDGEYVWVANKNDNTTSVIRTSDNTVVQTITVGSGPFGMAFTPDGRYVYQAVRFDGNIVVIDTETRNIITTIFLSGGDPVPKDIAITPDGNFAYVVSHHGLVWVIDLSSNTVVQTIGGARGGHTIRITKDGSRAYFSEGSYDYPNTMQTINLETNTLGSPIGSFDGSEGFDFTPDERYIYVMDRWADQIQKIDTETDLVVAIFTDGYIYDGYGVAISPDGLYGYATVPWISGNYGIHIFDTATDQFVGRLETDKRIREIITFDPTGLPWLTATPESGTLALGTSVDVELKISALGLRPGNYGAVVEVRSNDPATNSVRIPLRLKVLPPPIDPPEILSIDDVPADQGGWVTVSWNASKDDDFFSDTPVSFYSIWLRNNSPDGVTFDENEVLLRSIENKRSETIIPSLKKLHNRVEKLEKVAVQVQKSSYVQEEDGLLILRSEKIDQGKFPSFTKSAKSDDMEREITLPLKLNSVMSEGGDWIGIGTIGATQDSIYEFLVHTLSDSDSAGYNWSYLKISAHPENPFTFAFSQTDSGYSVDNLSPAVPSGLLASITEEDFIQLTWDAPVDEDFAYFSIFRSTESGFDPSVLEPYSETIDTMFIDTEVNIDQAYYYRLSAVDAHDNESEFSEEVSATIVGIEEGEIIPDEYLLGQNYPNPFNPLTTISYALPVAGKISLIIYDLNGREIIRWDEDISQGGYYQRVWNGENLSGEQVSSGVYFYRFRAGDFVQTKKMVLLR